MGVALICLSFLPASPTGCHSPLSALGRRQDGIRQGHLAVRQPRSCPVIWLVGKENIVIHAAKEEGREGHDKHKLSETAESAIITPDGWEGFGPGPRPVRVFHPTRLGPWAAMGVGLGGLERAGTTGTSISPQLEDILQQDTGKAVPLVVAVDVAGASRNKPEA